MRINKIGILKKEHIFEPTRLSTLKRDGIECACTDIAKVLGVSFKYKGEEGIAGYWTDQKVDPTKERSSVTYVTKDGKESVGSTDYSHIGVRIAINIEDITDFNADNLDSLKIEYPTFGVNEGLKNILDKLFNEKSQLIDKTGKGYDLNNDFFEEYEIFGFKFIKLYNKFNSVKLRAGTPFEEGNTSYFQVENIPFVFDEEAGIIYSKHVLFPMKYDNKETYFEKSQLYKYLNGKFLKSINGELINNNVIFAEPISEKQRQETTSNRYNFNFDSMSEEEIIENCIYAGISVFLHGKTGSGKTERVLSLDRNLELVDFGCTSTDGFTGIIAKDFNSKELFLYEPYWYKNLCKKCEVEPNLFHILYLEELTNAKSDVQKVAFEVTLNKTLTNSGFGLKLPPNAVVLGAGNEVSESRSANAMSEPLFSRFAHVYIDTDSKEWLKWASKRKKEERKLTYIEPIENNTIHPAIIDFIKINGDKVLRTKYDGIKPNADPRKWALASKALYLSNNPNILRAFVGKNITQEFIQFCKVNVLTVDDVLNNRCTKESVPLDSSLRLYTLMSLSTVDDENVDKVRDFVSTLGKEYLAKFDYEWSKNNEERVAKLFKENFERVAKTKRL